jgi:hypothetical protein
MFRFTIRDVLWLTVVASVGMAWALDHAVAAKHRAALRIVVERLREDGYSITADKDWVHISGPDGSGFSASVP